MMFEHEPKFELSLIIGGFFIYLGLLLFIMAYYLLALRTNGATSIIMLGTFSWALWVYVACLTMGILGFFIQLLRWLVWAATVPPWQKARIIEMDKLREK